MGTRGVLQADWYDFPQYYDIAFQSDTRLESDFVEAACRKYCPFRFGGSWSRPAAAGGSWPNWPRRGYELTGFDLNPRALDFLRQKLARRGLRAKTFEADMSQFRLARPVDAAYCPINTFRHLLTEQAARGHLECMADSLRPGGIYILGLHLLPLDADPESIERWTERQGQTQVTVTFRVLGSRPPPPDREPAGLGAGATRHKGTPLSARVSVPHVYAATVRPAVGLGALLELCDVFDFWYEIHHPLPWSDDLADTVVVLRKRG